MARGAWHWAAASLGRRRSGILGTMAGCGCFVEPDTNLLFLSWFGSGRDDCAPERELEFAAAPCGIPEPGDCDAPAIGAHQGAAPEAVVENLGSVLGGGVSTTLLLVVR